MKNKLRFGFGILCALAALICGAYLFWYYLGSGETQKHEKIRKEVQTEVTQTENTQTSEGAGNPVDFKKLQEVNPDVCAWIEVPETQIHYPVVQSLTHEEYYLDHTWDGKAGAKGAIFIQSYNRKDFTDFNTVIYGHEMGDGTMFNALHNYMDQDYWNGHQKVVVYTPGKTRTYQIFASVVYDDRHIMKTFHFTEATDRQKFLDSLYASRDLRSQYDKTVKVTAEDQIITLSTCIGPEPDKRYLVEAVLIDEK